MKNFQRKQKLRNIMYSRPVLIFLGILVVFFAWNVLDFWAKMEETNKNKKIIENRIIDLEKQKEKLSADINSLQTDQGKEKFFRENFGLAKEGEDVIIIVEDKSLSTAPVQPSSGFWSFLKNLLK